MNVERQLTMKCQYEESIVDDEEFMTESFKAPREIKCFKYGDRLNLINSDSVTRLSDQTYWVVEDVELGDKIDGQVIVSINPIPNLDGSIAFKEVRVAASV